MDNFIAKSQSSKIKQVERHCVANSIIWIFKSFPGFRSQ